MARNGPKRTGKDCFEMDEITTVEDLIEEARVKYLNAKRDKIDPMSGEWTKIAHFFQSEIRNRLVTDSDVRLQYVLLYFHRLNRMLRLQQRTQRKEFLVQQNLAKRMKAIAKTGYYNGEPAPSYALNELNYILRTG